MAKQVTVCIIGRGKSGTRIPAQLLLTGDGYIGKVMNASLDKTPFHYMYDAARLVGEYVEYRGNYQWDFNNLHSMPIPAQFKELIDTYLHDIYKEPNKNLKGWKLPETIFTYPLLVRHLPHIYYLFWHRDPYEVIRRHHGSQYLENYNINMPKLNGETQHEKDLERRAVSWLYQWQIVQKTPKPANFINMSYGDFVNDPERETQRLEDFLGHKLGRIVVRQAEPNRQYYIFPFLNNAYPQKNLV